MENDMGRTLRARMVMGEKRKENERVTVIQDS
jgi:hypothetical protein